MRIDTRNIHLQRPPFGLGDAQSQAARARVLALSPGINLPQAPTILSVSSSSGKLGDTITVTTDVPADGLNLLLPNQSPSSITAGGSQGSTLDSVEGGGTTTLSFKVPKPGTQEFPYPAGSYDLRAYSVTNNNYSATATPFTVNDIYAQPTTPHPVYVPAGVTVDAQGQLSVPGSPVWNGTSIIPPLSAPVGSAATSASPAPLLPSSSAIVPATASSSTSATSSGFTLPAIFTEESFGGIPNWVLMLGGLGALWYFGSKK